MRVGEQIRFLNLYYYCKEDKFLFVFDAFILKLIIRLHGPHMKYRARGPKSEAGPLLWNKYLSVLLWSGKSWTPYEFFFYHIPLKKHVKSGTRRCTWTPLAGAMSDWNEQYCFSERFGLCIIRLYLNKRE